MFKISFYFNPEVVQYLGRYIHRTAITNSRILAVENDAVTFRYKETRKVKKRWERKWRQMDLPAKEFMRRFLQHVLLRDFHKVRFYGLLTPGNLGC